VVNGLCFDVETVVGGDTFYTIAVVESGFEDLDLLSGNFCSTQPADQLLGLAAKHAAANDFQASFAVLCHESFLLNERFCNGQAYY
jgi:hypothetical protein